VKFASTRLISADIKGLVSFHEKLTGQTVEWLVPVFAETLHLWRQRYRDRREHGRTKLKWAVNQYLICQRNLPVSQEFDRFGSKLRSTRPSPDGAAERPARKPVRGSLNRPVLVAASRDWRTDGHGWIAPSAMGLLFCYSVRGGQIGGKVDAFVVYFWIGSCLAGHIVPSSS